MNCALALSRGSLLNRGMARLAAPVPLCCSVMEKRKERREEIGRDRGVIEIATPERKLLLSDAVARRVVVASHALRELTLGPDGIAGTECLVRHTVGF